MKAAHANAVENLAVFAALVLVAHAAGVSNSATVFACAVYFWARVMHLFAYTVAMPWARTFAFAAGLSHRSFSLGSFWHIEGLPVNIAFNPHASPAGVQPRGARR